jgi:glycosyltransferase involved in cell wall biosynthesis
MLNRVARRTGTTPDFVFFSWLDNNLHVGVHPLILDRVFPYSWSGLYFNPVHLRTKLRWAALRRGPLAQTVALRSPRCRGVAILDEGIADSLQRQLGGKPVIVFPDFADEVAPATDYPLARQVQEHAAGRRVIGLLGTLQRRKGLLTLLEVAEHADARDWLFVFAGVLDERTFTPVELSRIREIAQAAPENCFFHFGRIPTEADFNALVAGCDVLFAVYEHFPHSSNMLAKAAVFEKPIVVSNGYCMAERVTRFGLGRCVNEGNVAQCLDALSALLNPRSATDVVEKSNFLAYRQAHSIDQLRIRFRALLGGVSPACPPASPRNGDVPRQTG